MKVVLERVRFAAFAAGCASLFWQWDAAAADVFFCIGIIASLLLWEDGAPSFDLRWPQPLVLVFMVVTAVVTTLSGGSPRFFVITAYLVFMSLALASSLRHDPRRTAAIETGLVIAGAIASVLVAAGAVVGQLGLPLLQPLAYDYLRGQGLFKDPNVAGAFIACCYPLAAGRALRGRRARAVFLVLATAVFGAGVVFSYSRWALVLLAIGVLAILIVLLVRRDVRPLLGLGATALLAAAVGLQALPESRYQIQAYDETGRFAAWRLGFQLMLERPLGTGAGSFERIAVERYGPASGWTSIDVSDLRPAATPDPIEHDAGNLVRNAAFDGATLWTLPSYAEVIDDPTSPTGHALKKETTAIYQDPPLNIAVRPGAVYSFAAQIRTDGTPALLIIHWRDLNDVTIGQLATPTVTTTTWSESALLGQAAPADAHAAVVLLSNLEPGTQYFTALRMVEGSEVPAWSESMQRMDPARPVAADAGIPVPASAHNTYIRLAVESGLLGLAAVCLYWLVLLWYAWRNGRGSLQWPIAFTLALLAGLSIDTLHWRHVWVYTALVGATLAAIPTSGRSQVAFDAPARIASTP